MHWSYAVFLGRVYSLSTLAKFSLFLLVLLEIGREAWMLEVVSHPPFGSARFHDGAQVVASGADAFIPLAPLSETPTRANGNAMGRPRLTGSKTAHRVVYRPDVRQFG